MEIINDSSRFYYAKDDVYLPRFEYLWQYKNLIHHDGNKNLLLIINLSHNNFFCILHAVAITKS